MQNMGNIEQGTPSNDSGATGASTPGMTGASTPEMQTPDNSTPAETPGQAASPSPQVDAPAPADVISLFDNGDDGWRAEGGNFPAQARPTLDAEGGASGGAVSADSSGAWAWIAPPKFRGDKSAAYGQSLTFYLNRSIDGCSAERAERIVVLEGAGMRIHIDADYGPDNGWSYYSIGLVETEAWLHEDDNTRVTKEELLAVLSELGQLKIRGWFNRCDRSVGTGGLDDVVLKLDGLGRAAPAEPFLASRFDAGADGWAVANGSLDRGGPVEWKASGGSVGGQLTAFGANNWTWLAPGKFRGNMSAAYGKSLTFDLNRSNDDCRAVRAESLVKLQGGGYSIVHGASFGPDKAWTHYSVRLHETEPWFHQGTNDRVSGAEMRAVLADLGQIKIRGWFNFCDRAAGTGGLDNVVLELSGTDITSPAGGSIVSDFSDDDEQWAVADGSFGASGPVRVDNAGGNPGGFISADGSLNWYWIAPPKFRGDLSNAYGHVIRFDLNRSNDDCYARTAERLIVIEGAGMSIYFSGDFGPDKTWTAFSAVLSETELWFHTTTDSRVTKTEMQQVLAAVGQIKIRGWFNFCGRAAGTGGLDNVVVELE